MNQIEDREESRKCGPHSVIITSFGHKNGTPGADYVLNARKVVNPGQEYRNSTGLNKKVRQQVFKDDKAGNLVNEGVRVVAEEGVCHLGVGCDRGQHRSVSIAIEIGAELRRRGYDVTVVHRDIKTSP